MPATPGGVFALVCLRRASARQAWGGRGSHQPLLEVCDRPPGVVRGGARDTLLPPSSIRFHGVPVAVGPRGLAVVFSPCEARLQRRTSPKRRTRLDGSPVRTRRTAAPWRVGSLRVGGPSRPRPGRRSLCPASPPRGSVPLPAGRETPSGGGIGLPQWSVKQRRHGSVGVCTPVRRWEVATPSPVRWPSARPIGVMACPPLWPLSCHEV